MLKTVIERECGVCAEVRGLEPSCKWPLLGLAMLKAVLV